MSLLKAQTPIRAASSRPLSRPKRRVKKRRTQEERSEATRGQLIEAAVTCLSELGYLEATVGVVASRAGVSRGAVQHHFGSRADLLIAVVDDLGIALSRSKDIPPDLSIPDRISMSIDQTWQLLGSPHFKAVVQIWLAMQSEKKVFAAVKAKVAHIEDVLDKKWLGLFPDVRLPPKQVTMIRHVALATLRGLSLRSTYRQEQAASSGEIEALKVMVTAVLTRRT
jgi:AcrR family transcriptional regulator